MSRRKKGRIRTKRQRRICRNKRRFKTQTEAVAAAIALSKDRGIPTRAYVCPGTQQEIRHWHITSSVQGGKPDE